MAGTRQNPIIIDDEEDQEISLEEIIYNQQDVIIQKLDTIHELLLGFQAEAAQPHTQDPDVSA